MNAVMNAELNQLKGPVQTKGGYSLFKVVERYDEVYHGLDNERVRNSVTRDVREKYREKARRMLIECGTPGVLGT